MKQNESLSTAVFTKE